MTSRQRHRHEMLRRIACWMRQHGAWLVLALAFSAVLPNAARAAELKQDSYAELVKSLEKEKESKKVSDTQSNLTVKSAPTPVAAQPEKKEAKQNREVKKNTQDVKKEVEKTVEKNVTGTVMFIRKNKMSVEFSGKEGAGDMYIPLDANVKLQRAKSFSEIKQGDKVKVKYKLTYLDPKEKGGEPVVLKTVGIEITLLKSAVLQS